MHCFSNPLSTLFNPVQGGNQEFCDEENYTITADLAIANPEDASFLILLITKSYNFIFLFLKLI